MPGFRFNTKNVDLTKSEQKIMDYIYNHLSMIPYYSIGNLSEQLEISIATLSRFVRHIGYDNYKDLKNAIMEHESTSPAIKLNSTISTSGSETVIQHLLKESEYIKKTLEDISETEIIKAVELIAASERIYLFGKGASKGLAEYFSFRLDRFHKFTKVVKSSGSEVFEDLIHIGKNDLIIIFGFHKIPIEAKILLDYKKEAGYTTLLFTDRLYSQTNQLSDVNLYVYRGEPKEYHSMAAPIAVIDSLVIQVAKQLKDSSLQNLSALYELKERYVEDIPR